VEYSTSPVFVLRLEKWRIIPEGQNERFCDDLLDPVFDLSEDDGICDLTRADDGLYSHFDLGHLLEREPHSIARRGFDLDESVPFQLSNNNSEHEIDFSWLEAGAQVDTSRCRNLEAKIARIPDICLNPTFPFDGKILEARVGDERRRFPRIDSSDFYI